MWWLEERSPELFMIENPNPGRRCASVCDDYVKELIDNWNA